MCDSNVNVTLERNLIDNSKIIYKIKGDMAQIILNQNGEKKILNKCYVNKQISKTKKKNFFKKMLEKLF